MSIWAVRTGDWVEFRSASKAPTVVRSEAKREGFKIVQDVVEGGRLLVVGKHPKVIIRWGGVLINLRRSMNDLPRMRTGEAVEVPTEIAQPLLKRMGHHGRIKTSKAAKAKA